LKLNHQCRATRRTKVDGPASGDRFGIGSTTGVIALGTLGKGQHLLYSIRQGVAVLGNLSPQPSADDGEKSEQTDKE
jgi:hypothetical protein